MFDSDPPASVGNEWKDFPEFSYETLLKKKKSVGGGDLHICLNSDNNV